MARAPLLAGDPSRVGRYRLTARLGSGGMGVVYLGAAKDGSLVAVKVLRPELAEDPEFRARFSREVATLTRVRGMCTVRVIEADTGSPRPFLVTEYADGPSLAEYIASHGPLGAEMLYGLATGLAEALSAIHAAGVVHRDLKTSNVLLTAGSPKVIDFGIAQALDATALTRTGMMIGSAGFMAPEQILGQAGTASDVFAWAVTVGYAASGRPPFGTGPSEAIMYRVIHAEPDIAGVPASLRPQVQACLAKEPRHRPTAQELLRQLTNTPAQPGGGYDVPTQTILSRTWRPAMTGPEPHAAQTGTSVPVVPRQAPAGPGLPPAPPRERRRPVRAYAALSLAVLAAVAGTAVGLVTAGQPAKSTSTSGGQAGAVYGGTLHLVASTGPDHIDTVPAYYSADYALERGYARQLVTYPTVPATSTSSPGWAADVLPVADAATQVPTVANGGITNGGKTYTFRIRPGVDWDSAPVRQVTADDFIREFKAFCNPVSPVGNLGYYESTITGFTAYCAAEDAFFASKSNAPTAANIASFQDAHEISGITAPDPLTLRFTLTSPASDFLYLLAMTFCSARPAEYDRYLPDSLQLDQHTLSDGPYQISSYRPGTSITLIRNPAWKQSTDPVRHDYVSGIVVTEGVTSAAAQLSDLQAGTQDLPVDTPIDPASVPALVASKVPNFVIWPQSDLFQYIVFNLRSPDANGAAGRLLVRQAVEYGLDKSAVLRAVGGPDVATIVNTVIPPGNMGFANSAMYPDDNGQGNVAMCKRDLGKAGYPHGVTLTYMYPEGSADIRVFTAIQASLANCGIRLTGKRESGASFFTDLGNAPANNKPGAWDMGQAGWIPDWFGDNGRTIIQALFQGPDCVVNTVNYGCYDSSTVDSLITQAENAPSLSAAAAAWHQADSQIMSDAAIVPLMSQKFPLYASKRVRGVGYPTAIFNPNIGGPDITDLWLAGG